MVCGTLPANGHKACDVSLGILEQVVRPLLCQSLSNIQMMAQCEMLRVEYMNNPSMHCTILASHEIVVPLFHNVSDDFESCEFHATP